MHQLEQPEIEAEGGAGGGDDEGFGADVGEGHADVANEAGGDLDVAVPVLVEGAFELGVAGLRFALPCGVRFV